MTDRPQNERRGKRFRLGDIWVTPSGNEVGGVRVEAKAIDVLLELVDAAPNPLSARALLQRVWPDVVVVDNVVYQAISQLRKALGDDAQAPRFIDNVPRRGYRLIAEVVRGPPATVSSRGSLLRVRHNLPTHLTSFVGREHELAEVGQLLAAHRLVTVVGVGGCGKTRLALAVANARLDDFPAGVWLVDLAAITDPGQVISAVAKALGARATAGLSLHESLLAVLEKQQCLIVLDNCEHLIDVCVELAEAMLRRAPALRVLATSREALGIAGEHPWRIQPLAVPDPAMEPTIERMERIESVRLFIERAAVAMPGYALTEHNGSALARICRQLEGIPLALELAAARVQTLSTEDIALRLADSFRMLTGGSRTAPPRQRTLQATLDWSHDLLSAPQQGLLRRLSVFINGFTLTAAEGVCGSDPLAPEDILDQLTRLIERSMVQVVNTSRALRYRLLEPVRQYGQGKLVECGEVITTRNRHRDYFVALSAEFADISREGIQSNDIYPRFLAESGDFGLALAWCLETDVGKGLKLATFLCRFMSTYEVAMNTGWLETFLARTSETEPDRAEALCLSVMRNPDPTRRRSRLQQALAIARRTGDQWVETLSLVQLGNTLALSGEPAEGMRLVESALDLARNTGNANMLGWCLYFTDIRRMPRLRGYGDECIVTFGNAGNKVGHVLALRKWVGALLEQPLDCVPREQIDELVALSREQGYFQGIMVGLGLLGHFAEQKGDLHRALRFMEEANDVAPTAGLWLTEHDLARVLSRLGEFERAAALYRDYLRRGLPLSALTPIAFAHGLLGLAFIATRRSQCDLAARLYGASRRFRGERPRGIRGMTANEIKLQDDVIRMVSAALGETSWVRLCAEGESMTLQQATVLAMTDDSLDPELEPAT